MKRYCTYIIMFVSLLHLAGSCSPAPCPSCGEDLPTNHVRIFLQGSCVETRATDVPSLSESNVVRSDLFIFDSEGAMVGSIVSTDGRFDFYLTDGVYDFVAVANKGELPSKDVTRDQLLSTVVTLGENAPGSFVMVGRLDHHEILSDEKLSVEVERLAAKLSCTIRTDFKGYLASERLTIDAVYLTNVMALARLGAETFDKTPDSLWFNRMAYEPLSGAYPAELLYEACGTVMGPRDSLVTGCSLYALPNDAADSRDTLQWTPRCTRLVVEATLSGRKTFYPVTIGKVESNRHYMVDLAISNFGADHPEGLPHKHGDVDFSLRVGDWTDGRPIEAIY